MNVTESTLCRWSIPTTRGTPHELTARVPGITVIVGPNGAGKSALGHWLETNANGAEVHRLIAHRRLWFEHAGPAITAARRTELQRPMTLWSLESDSRWLDHAHQDRANVVLFDLLARVNERNARVASLVDKGVAVDEIAAQVEPSLLTRLNTILGQAQLHVQLSITESSMFEAASVRSGATYPISQMSDGEKSALLLAAEVLAVPRACVQIIDEPERHLHRSISAGLIEAILHQRPDCHFVVLTHDLDLASLLARAEATQTIVLSGCGWGASGVTSWHLNVADADHEIPESVRHAILGGKGELLFVEGDAQSLDSRLYALLFPGWEVRARGGCEQVIRAVVGLTASTNYHWIAARGIIDRDGRGETETAALREKGVLVLPVHEIESLYYLPTLVRAVAAHQAANLEQAPEQLSTAAIDSALAALSAPGTAERLSSELATQILSRDASAALPTAQELQAGTATVSLTLDSPFPALLELFQRLLAERDLDQLVRRVSIRDTALRAQVAKALAFRSSYHYEAAARSRLVADEKLAAEIRAIVGELP